MGNYKMSQELGSGLECGSLRGQAAGEEVGKQDPGNRNPGTNKQDPGTGKAGTSRQGLGS